MTNIYELHDSAFRYVSAYVILKDNEMIAKVAFKFPKDGAGRLWAYIHFFGLAMVRDYAGGYGYDKRSAAATHAAAKIVMDSDEYYTPESYEERTQKLVTFKAVLADIGGKDWTNALHDAGYTVIQAV